MDDLISENQRWKEEIGWDEPTVMKAINTKSERQTCVGGELFIDLVKKFQKKRGIQVDGIVGPNTWKEIQDSLMTDRQRAINKIMEETIIKESGGRYCAMNRDGEFRGLFDGHRSEGKIHIGLSFGILQFTQDSGQLGKYLKKCSEINESRFKSIMGPTWDELLTVTNRPGRSGFATGELRGPRVKKVSVQTAPDGTREPKDLWEEPWVSKFGKLCKVPEFQRAQEEMAVRDYLEPMLTTLNEIGFDSEKMVAASFSGAIHRGVGGMRSFMGRVDDGKMSEKDLLRGMVDRDPSRFKSFLDNEELSWGRWAGWPYF